MWEDVPWKHVKLRPSLEFLIEISIFVKILSVPRGCRYSPHTPQTPSVDLFGKFRTFSIPTMSLFDLGFNQKLTLKNRLKRDFDRIFCYPQIEICAWGCQYSFLAPKNIFLEKFEKFRTFSIPLSSSCYIYFRRKWWSKHV